MGTSHTFRIDLASAGQLTGSNVVDRQRSHIEDAIDALDIDVDYETHTDVDHAAFEVTFHLECTIDDAGDEDRVVETVQDALREFRLEQLP